MKCAKSTRLALLTLVALCSLSTRQSHGQGYDPDKGAKQAYSAIKAALGENFGRHPVHYVFLINTAQAATNNNPALITNSQAFVSNFCDRANEDEKTYTSDTKSTLAIRTYQLELYPNEGGTAVSLGECAKLGQATIRFHSKRPNGDLYHSVGGGSLESQPRSALLREIGAQTAGRINICIQLTPNSVAQPNDPSMIDQTQGQNQAKAGLEGTGFHELAQFNFAWDAGHDDKTKEYFCWIYGPDPIPSSGLVEVSRAPALPLIKPQTQGNTTASSTEVTQAGASSGAIVAGIVVILVILAVLYWFMLKSLVVIDGASFTLSRLAAIKLVGEGGGTKTKLKYTIPPSKLLQPNTGTIAEIAFGLFDFNPVIRSQGVQIEAGGKRGNLVMPKPDKDVPVSFYTITAAGVRSNIATINIKIGKPKVS